MVAERYKASRSYSKPDSINTELQEVAKPYLQVHNSSYRQTTIHSQICSLPISLKLDISLKTPTSTHIQLMDSHSRYLFPFNTANSSPANAHQSRQSNAVPYQHKKAPSVASTDSTTGTSNRLFSKILHHNRHEHKHQHQNACHNSSYSERGDGFTVSAPMLFLTQ
jgi:hypothetical protein